MTDEFTTDFIAASASADSGAPPDVSYEIKNEPTMDPNTGANPGFGGQFSDGVNFGVFNGAFRTGPPDPTANIDPWNAATSNFMPNWRFVQAVNANITASQVRDVASPSGSNLRFTVASGAVGDDAYFEQFIDIGGSRARQIDHRLRAEFLRVTATAAFDVYIQTQYLKADGTTTGSSFETAVSATVDGTIYIPTVQSGNGSP